MIVDLPFCDFENCKYCFEGNCIKESKYQQCEFRRQKENIERLQRALVEHYASQTLSAYDSE